jgi:hypothetical protein
MRDDFPTFDLPINANSGLFRSGGHLAQLEELMMKSAETMSID